MFLPNCPSSGVQVAVVKRYAARCIAVFLLPIVVASGWFGYVGCTWLPLVLFSFLIVTASSVLAQSGVLPTNTQLNWIANQLLIIASHGPNRKRHFHCYSLTIARPLHRNGCVFIRLLHSNSFARYVALSLRVFVPNGRQA
jgi:hypothetical protein